MRRKLLGWAIIAAAGTAGAEPLPKRLVATGWDHADSGRLRENREAMERRPFDGVVIQVEGRKEDGGRVGLFPAFSRDPWTASWFDPCLEDLRACSFKRFSDNFILIGANPGDVDWFDDEGWRAIAEHWRIAARLVKEARFAGILFDPEPYTDPHAQFRYRSQREWERRPFGIRDRLTTRKLL